ncbi:hypothetical protein EES47_20960 [Streptomyces sp. ADI98-12]|nr:hypothetical protein EES47_20960 [Streptomyces sp. ADI98-12]
MTWACTVTSSAVVGSSAMISLGSSAIAMAIMMRWRIPPENWCGYWLTRSAAAGMRTRSISSTAFALASLRDMPRCTVNISPSWSPTVSTGLSEESASWKIIAISAPRTLRRRSSLRGSRSRPSKRIWPPVMCPGGVSRMPMTAWAVTDLPEPDSPRTASVSPASTE